ncbi:unnamed protein product [Symbiodinium natans]|uniref:Phospholipase/carboxylesterase/thioesterase domain-containing protein n=1 Tax=Symbiodinium natans TaxID=878477 RepID=A0A812JLV9_9DINO|nr:unnamed protein product [Symbiodinium natans]
MAPRQWKVVGGGSAGGIVVRSGQKLTSEQLGDRLATGALVKELKLEGDRLNFELVSGKGPDAGWVSLKLKDKDLLVEVDAEGNTVAKDALKKKSWDTKFLFKGCGANIRALEGGTEGASRDQLFEFLMRQHVSPELRKDFWPEIPDHLYDTAKTSEMDCITFFQTVGHLACEPSGKRLPSPGGVRQRLERFGDLRCIVVEPDAMQEPPKLVAVLAHGIEVLGDDLYGLAHRLCTDGLRVVLPEAPSESAQPREEDIVENVGQPIDESQREDLDEWRKPLREWWSRSVKEKDIEKCLSQAAEGLTACAAAAKGDAKLVLGGFSQGSLVALAAAKKAKPSGLILLCPPGAVAAPVAKTLDAPPPALVASGSEDIIAPRDGVHQVHEALTSAGSRAELVNFEGGHEVTMKVVDAVRAFLLKSIRS